MANNFDPELTLSSFDEDEESGYNESLHRGKLITLSLVISASTNCLVYIVLYC